MEPLVTNTGRLWLIGSMGAGKTAVGTAVGALLGWPLLDNDVELERGTGASLLDLASDGPGRLHASESQQLHTAAARRGPFVAGVAASVADRPEDLKLLRSNGFVVYLRATPQTLAARVGKGEDRPWLGQDPITWLTSTIGARGPAYESTAHFTIDVDNKSVAEVAEAIVAEWGRLRRSGQP